MCQPVTPPFNFLAFHLLETLNVFPVISNAVWDALVLAILTVPHVKTMLSLQVMDQQSCVSIAVLMVTMPMRPGSAFLAPKTASDALGLPVPSAMCAHLKMTLSPARLSSTAS